MNKTIKEKPIKAAYLKDNPNSRGIREDYWTEEQVQRNKESLAEETWIHESDMNGYHIIIGQEHFELQYEEMVEILAAMRTCALGNEAFISAKLKADRMWENIPVSSY